MNTSNTANQNDVAIIDPPTEFLSDLRIIESKFAQDLKQMEKDHERFFRKYPNVFTEEDAMKEINELVSNFKAKELMLKLTWRNFMLQDNGAIN